LNRPGLGVVAGSFLYLYANLFALPGTPFLLGGDQALFWSNAQRLLHGELIYRDFLEFTPPGTDLIYLVAFRSLGSWIGVPNIVVLLLGVGLTWLCFRVARSLLNPAQAALAAALFLVLDYGKILNGTHHWFSMAAVIGAVAVLQVTRTPARIAIAGALLGVATFFTQTKGLVAAVGIGIYLIRERTPTKHLFLLPVSLLAGWALLSSYFIARVGLEQLWYFQVTYLLQYVAHAPAPENVPDWMSTRLGIEFLVVLAVVPIIYAIALWKGFRTEVMLVAIVGVALFVEVACSPNWVRLYCVVMPAIILFLWLSSRQRHATTVMWTALICIAVWQTGSRHHQQAVIADLPAGRAATTTATAEKLVWLAGHTTPGELLFEARWVDVYLPLAVRNPLFTDMLDGGHDSRPEFVDRSLRQLAAWRIHYVIWSPRLESPLYPFAHFHRFLTEHYDRVMTFPDQDEVWARK
jgi:hypothetical protein